jgi:hypothetical protein
MDFASFASDNAARSIASESSNCWMIQPGKDQKVISALTAQMAKQKKDGLGARVFRVAFESCCLQRIEIL